MRKSRILAAACLGMLFWGGCESVELEQRSFPLAVGIDLQEAQEKTGGKETEGKQVKEKGEEEETERKLVVSFDFPDLAQISDKGKTVDTPMAMSLEGDDLFHVEKSYENNTNRILDYNHLKAVVIWENFISEHKR